MKLTKKQLADVAASSSFMQEFKHLLWTTKCEVCWLDKVANCRLLPSEKTLDEIAIKLFNRHFKHTIKVSISKRKQ